MKSFVFVTHKTPKHLQSNLRKELFTLYRHALLAQTYKNWKVLIIGEEESQEGPFKTVKLEKEKGDIKEQLKVLYDRIDVQTYLKESDYLIKLDDDDLISPLVLEKASNLDFDVYFDTYHAVYDISSGMQTQRVTPWIASTCIHKTAHAFHPINMGGPKNLYLNSVLYTDHSKVWHVYYSDKKKLAAEPTHPVYLRILSPTSITAGGERKLLEKLGDIDFKAYYNYLKTFGYWQTNASLDFEPYKPQLTKIWRDFAGQDQESIKGVSPWNRIKDRLTNYAKRARKIFR